MNRRRRLLLGIAGGIVLLAAIVAGLAFTPRVQTWAVRRSLESRPELGMSIERVRLRPGVAHLEGLRIKSGATVVTVPSADITLPLLEAARGRVRIARLVAKGWRVDVGQPGGPAVPAGAPFQVVAGTIQSVFHSIRLPVDLAMDAVELEGEMSIPAAGGKSQSQVRLIVSGGGLGAGRVGMFSVTGYAAFAANEAINALSARGSVELAMDTPRTFTRTAVKLEVDATGARFPDGTRLIIDAGAGRAESGDSYTIRIDGTRGQLVLIQGRYLVDSVQPGPVQRMGGVWNVNLRDSDLAPFTFGFPVPEFALDGRGSFQFDAAAEEFGLSGELAGTAGKLGVLRPELAAFGSLEASTTFDLKQRGTLMHVAAFGLNVGAGRPIAAVRALQPFEFDVKSGVPLGADPSKDLLSVEFHGLPPGWIQPFVPQATIGADDISAEFSLGLLRSGIATLRSTRPVAISRLSYSTPTGPLLAGLDLGGSLVAEYSANGWQVEFREIELREANATFLKWSGRAGRLAGADQPMKLTGQVSVDLPALLRQPVAAGKAQLIGGKADASFSASLGSLRSIQVKLALDNLAVSGPAESLPLPKIDADVRADFTAGGAIALKLPIVLERKGRKSDLLLDGSVAPRPAGFAITGRVTSEFLSFEDVSSLAAAFAAKPGAPDRGAPAAAFWDGVTGEVALALKKVSYAEMVEATDVGGWIRFDEGSVRFDQVRAAMKNGSDFSITGGVTFDAMAREPYALKAALAVSNYDIVPAFRALHPDREPMIAGKFNITSQIMAAATSPAELPARARAEIQLTSRGGNFRLLRVDLSDKVQSGQSRVAAVGDFIGSVTGTSRISDYANLSRIVSDIAHKLSDIPFHQMSVTLASEPSGYRIRDFTLLAPEIRLQGNGKLSYRPGHPFVSEAFELRLQMGARGVLADSMRRAGLLSGMDDALGYASFTMPLNLAGTLEEPGNSELRDKLIEAAGASLMDVLRR